MKKLSALVFFVAFASLASASWYWPFGDDDEKEPPRLSELMAPATELISEATDLAADGKTSEAIQKYREALAKLERIEVENPERAKSPEFATLRNKRAYVNATIDSMILNQVRSNAKVIAVSDTRDLEKRLAEEKANPKGKPEEKAAKAKSESKSKPEAKAAKTSKATAKAKAKKRKVSKPATPREQAIRDIANGDYAAADLVIKAMLKDKPNNAMALNLRAVMEAKQGDFKAAEQTLDQAISSNPRDYHAYYNMAMVMLQNPNGSRDGARRYYETGRAMGGPANAVLAKEFK